MYQLIITWFTVYEKSNLTYEWQGLMWMDDQCVEMRRCSDRDVPVHLLRSRPSWTECTWQRWWPQWGHAQLPPTAYGHKDNRNIEYLRHHIGSLNITVLEKCWMPAMLTEPLETMLLKNSLSIFPPFLFCLRWRPNRTLTSVSSGS